MSEYKKIIKNSKFMHLWTSQMLSQLTINMMNFLLLTRLFSVTGSSMATALLWVTYALPSVFLGPIGAASVDLINKRKMLMATNLLQAIVVLMFFFFHAQSIFLLYFVVFAYSVFNQFYVPAEAASLIIVVDKKSLPSANSIFFITQQAALLLGFGFGGILEKLIGFDGSLLLSALFLFLAFISVSFLTDIKDRSKIPDSFEEIISKFISTIVEGYNFIKSHKIVLYPLVLVLILQAYLAIVVANLPVIGSQILKIGLSFSGLTVVIPAGIGAFIGSVVVPRRLRAGTRKKTLIDWGLLLCGISLLLLASGVSYLPPFFRVTASVVLIMAVGVGYVLANIPTLTFLQESTPPDIRGRVFGNLSFLVTIVTIFPVLFSGFVSEILGVKFILGLMGALTLIIFVFMKRRGAEIIKNNF